MRIFNLFTITRCIKPERKITPVKKRRKVVKVEPVNAFCDIGMYIKRFRLKRGYHQYELANLANISESTVSRLERGEKPLSDKTARKIGKILKINLIGKIKQLNQKAWGIR